MKKIAIIGASGYVGEAILKEALERNYKVLAIARNIDKLKSITSPNLTLKSVDVNNTNALAEMLKGYDVVISAFNAGWTNPNLYEDNMKGFESIEKAVREARVTRFILIGGGGTLLVDGKYVLDSPDFPEQIKPGAKACRDYFKKLEKEADFNWTYFSPALEMTSKVKTGRTGKYRLGTNTPVFNEEGRSIISAEDAAVAIMDEVENQNYLREQFTAAY